jgi:hypothetical protein
VKAIDVWNVFLFEPNEEKTIDEQRPIVAQVSNIYAATTTL